MKALLIIALICLTSMSATSEDIASLLGVISEADRRSNPHDALMALDAIRAQTEFIDSPTVTKLLDVVGDFTLHGAVRFGALQASCELVKPQDAGKILSLMTQLATQYRQAKRKGKIGPTGQDEFFQVPTMTYEFLSSGASLIAARLSNPKLLLDYYIDLIDHRVVSDPNVKRVIAARIADNPAELPVRQEYANRLVEAYPLWPSPVSLYGLMDAEFADRLRPQVLTGKAGVESFNYCAVGLLADYGDAATATLLRNWANTQADPEEARNRIERMTWKIDAQHNTQLLLDYISSDQWHGYQRRNWALQKALKLGVPPSQIKAAILEHAPKAWRHVGLANALVHLKQEAVSKGVLSLDDLPNVKPPTAGRVEGMQRAREIRERVEQNLAGN